MKIKLEWSAEMIDSIIGKLNGDRENYRMILTNYTCLIEHKDFDYHFMKHLQAPAVFSVSNEIKRYLDTSMIHIDEIDRNKIRYYSAKVVTRPIYLPYAYSIDINAAYPTCLFNNRFIDQKVYWKLMNLDKQERLASIGMIASRRRIFTIEQGEVKQYEDHESEYSRYFFYCVQKIHEIIWQCEVQSGTSFVYSWVDCLYVTDRKAAENCRSLLLKNGYKSTVNKLQDFQYVPDENKIRVSFLKDNENKVFNIPVEENVMSKIIKTIHK